MLSTTSLRIEPGGEGLVTVTVRNGGTVVDRLAVDVLGAAAAWTVVEPPVVNLFPGQQSEVQLRFMPPAGAFAPVGEVPFGVRVRSSAGLTPPYVDEGVIEVSGAAQVSVEVRPLHSRGRVGRHRVLLRNTGNVAVRPRIAATEPDDLLQLELGSAPYELGPGESAEVSLVARPVARHRPRMNERAPFTLTVGTATQVAATVDASFERERVVPRWTVPALGVVAGLTAAAVAFMLLSGGMAPQSDARSDSAIPAAESSVLPSGPLPLVPPGGIAANRPGPGLPEVRLSAPDLVVPSPLELHNGGAPAPAGGGVTAAPRPRPVSTVAPRKLAPAHPGTRTGATNVASGTALVSMHRGHIDAFWRGTDNGLWHQWRDLAYRDGGWVPPERIGRFTFTKAPAAASWGDNRIDVMMRGTDGRLYQVYFDGVWHDVPTQVMPGGRPAAPAGSPALTSRHAGHLDVFWRDNNSHLMHSWYDSRYWGSSATFEGPEQLGGATQMSSDPAVASPDDYRTDVFARSSRHGLLHLYWVDRAGWSPWAIVPGVSNVVTAPTAVCQRGNEYPHNMAVAYQGLDGQLWHVWSLDSSRWHAPVSLGGAPVTAPGAASWSDRRVDVVFRDAAGALRHKYYDGAWHL